MNGTVTMALTLLLATIVRAQDPTPVRIELQLSTKAACQYECVIATTKVVNVSGKPLDVVAFAEWRIEKKVEQGHWREQRLATACGCGPTYEGDGYRMGVDGVRYSEGALPAWLMTGPGHYRVVVPVVTRRTRGSKLRVENATAEFVVREHPANVKALEELAKPEPGADARNARRAVWELWEGCESSYVPLLQRKIGDALATEGITAELRRWLLLSRVRLLLQRTRSESSVRAARRDLAVLRSMPLPTSECGSVEGRVEYFSHLCEACLAVDEEQSQNCLRLYSEYADAHPGVDAAVRAGIKRECEWFRNNRN